MRIEPELKFVWNGIKFKGKLYRAWYSNGKLMHYPEGTITIYGKDYQHFPNIGMEVHNNSDLMTDYFEKDRIRVAPGDPWYELVVNAHAQQEEHQRRRFEKRFGKGV